MTTIVIGAGLAGIFTARELAANGEEVVVLEATEHIAGRTRTDRDALVDGQPADLGASFIDRGQDAIIKFCLDHDIELSPRLSLFPLDEDGSYDTGSLSMNPTLFKGEWLTDAKRSEVRSQILAGVEEAQPHPWETLDAWARRARLSEDAARIFALQAGLSPTSTSSWTHMSHVHPPEIGYMCWLVADGTDTIASRAAEGLDIRLSEPVRVVARSDRGTYVVETDRSSYECDDVVIATSLVASRRIAFEPALPAWKLDALLGAQMSQGGKVVGQYRDGQEIARQFRPAILTDQVIGCAWTRPVAEDGSITVLGLVPDRADGILSDPEAVLQAMDDALASLTDSRHERMAGVVQDWSSEPFFGGIVSLLSGNFLTLSSSLGRQVAGIHFAGEHTASSWQAAMEGAIRSGQRAAGEVQQRRMVKVGTSKRSRTPRI